MPNPSDTSPPSLWETSLAIVGDGSTYHRELARLLERRVAPFARSSTDAPATDLHQLFESRLRDWNTHYTLLRHDHDAAQAFHTLTNSPYALAVFWYPFASLFIMGRRALGRGTTVRLRTSLAEGRCPDCRYPLRETNPAFGKHAPLAAAGPPACPECGTAWPLIPPPPGNGLK